MLFFVVPFIFPVDCFAQRETIDSLNKILRLLRDSARVDCLNALSGNYLELNNDTAAYYAALASEEVLKKITSIAESPRRRGWNRSDH